MSQSVLAGTDPAPAIEVEGKTEVAQRSGALPAGLLLLLITVLALAVRLYGLTDYGIWTDEAYHLALIKLPTTAEMLGAVLANPPSDPLYVLALRGWAGLFGTGDASVRALSVIIGTLTVPVTFALGAVLAGRAAGLLGALLLALSPYAVEFSQEAALYALAALLSTLALALGIRWQRTGRGGVAYVMASAVALYSHYVVAALLGLFVLGSALPYFNAANRVPVRRFLLASGVAFVMWLPWLVPLLNSWGGVAVPRSSLSQDLTASYVLGALGQYTAGTAALLNGSHVLLALGILAAGVLLFVAWMCAGRPNRRVARLLMAIAALLFVIPAVTAAISGRWVFVPHLMLFTLPALFGVASAGCVWASSSPESAKALDSLRGVIPVAFAALLLTQGVGLIQFYASPPHGADGLREMAAVLHANSRPGEPVLVTPPALAPSLAQYFDGALTGLPEDFDLRRVYLPYGGEDWRQGSLARVTAAVANARRFWLVYRPERDDGGRLLEHLRATYTESSSQPFKFATLYLFEVP